MIEAQTEQVWILIMRLLTEREVLISKLPTKMKHDTEQVWILIADIYISISTETFDIENIKYEKTLATVRFRYIL